MNGSLARRALTLAQRRLTLTMLIAYAAAALVPAFGLAVRHARLGAVPVPGGHPMPVTLPSLLLAFVLFTASVQISARQLPALVRRPLPLLTGTVANTLVPLMLLPMMAVVLGLLPDSDGCSGLLTGMALIGAMPVAGGATVWGDRAGGNHSLVVGIVLASTLISPLTIPLTLHAASAVTSGHYSDDLTRMARTGGGAFAVAGVVAPCLAGLAVRTAFRGRGLDSAVPWLKLISLVAAVFLTYSNASGALGGFLRDPRPALLVASVVTAAGMCTASFAIGWGLARILRATHADTVAITFASGMNNSSASAVLAATRLPDYPQVLLPVLAYSLLQKLLAGLTDSALLRRGNVRASSAGPT
ncbi:bile acid:sodium symporter family protein [Streptomyces beijiangensis]|uniref:Sodium-dependent transporter n=1 Tax=Streptomyces beijiangensis TaxID=163361 RepID=A0A939FDY6_9ACTN|nr:sodium-dependent transporter [Streptomyces beijiangensis]MBO0516339.1 sodium-dependent transporter [Streptomyces beijiangensis]